MEFTFDNGFCDHVIAPTIDCNSAVRGGDDQPYAIMLCVWAFVWRRSAGSCGFESGGLCSWTVTNGTTATWIRHGCSNETTCGDHTYGTPSTAGACRSRVIYTDDDGKRSRRYLKNVLADLVQKIACIKTCDSVIELVRRR
jgi:hypothetical protein